MRIIEEEPNEKRDRKADDRATILWIIAIIAGVCLIGYLVKHWDDGVPMEPDPALRSE